MSVKNPQLSNKFEKIDEHLVKQLIEYGHTESFIRHALRISFFSWERWKKQYPKWSAKLELWKEKADEKVERALYERAIGYRTEVNEMTKYGDIAAVEKVYPPDVPAIIFWLTNRQKDKWKNKQEVEHSGDIEMKIKTDKKVLQEKVDDLVEASL